MKHSIRRTIALLLLAATCLVSCESRKYKQSNPDVLNSRQIKILEENSLPTEMSQLNGRQKSGIKEIESALVYLEEKYPGVEFEYISHTQAGLMNTEDTKFVPVGYDKEDDRNIVTVNYDRDGNYSDDYMLVAVREETENTIKQYLISYFGEDNFKVYVHPMGTNLEFGDEISEETVKGGNVRSVAELLLPDDICSKEKLNEFAEAYRNVYDVYRCRFSASIINKKDFDNFTYKNMYDDTKITITYNLEISNNQ